MDDKGVIVGKKRKKTNSIDLTGASSEESMDNISNNKMHKQAGNEPVELIKKTDSLVEFVVHGHPEVLERPRVSKNGHLYNPSKAKQQKFQQACTSLFDEPFSGPIEVTLTFLFERPLYHYRTGKFSEQLKSSADIWHTKSKDIDNLVKFVLDALNKTAYADDRQVAVLKSSKLYSDDGARVVVAVRKLDTLKT